ncbi:MAG: FtsW/RodA/SpoVE family cell cycle protein, partial [Bacteroidota bacterium]|nr:FtsW/RodA/SpoVE family cell cycle protein [Bacteroidota bacterium]
LTLGIVLIPAVILILAAVIRHKTIDPSAATHQQSTHSHLLVRVDTWINRVENFVYGGKASKEDDNYQVNQAKIAVANGGWIGLGPGNSRQRNFLPHPYSDFIYAIIIEEYGLIGGAVIMFIYLVFLFRSIRIFRKCPFAFGAFLALGLSFTLMIQAVANMAVNVNLFPVTGVTLPLISMGGSSFLFTCLAIGIILSVARNAEKVEGEKLENLEI